MNEPFHSIASATIFLLFGLLFGFAAASGMSTVIAGAELGERALYTLTGVSFVMSYFALIHLKNH